MENIVGICFCEKELFPFKHEYMVSENIHRISEFQTNKLRLDWILTLENSFNFLIAPMSIILTAEGIIETIDYIQTIVDISVQNEFDMFCKIYNFILISDHKNELFFKKNTIVININEYKIIDNVVDDVIEIIDNVVDDVIEINEYILYD
jgi:hypothetical protein